MALEARATGYSGTPLARKLGIGEGMKVLCLDAPADFTIPELPAAAELARRAGKGPYPVALVFVREAADVKPRFARAAARVAEGGAVWMVWPKKSSGVVTDVTEDVLRALILPTGFVDTKVCAVDSTWSGLRFVLRVSRRAPR